MVSFAFANKLRSRDRAVPRPDCASFARGKIDIEPAPEIFFRGQWLEHRVPNLFGKNARQMVRLFHLLVLGVDSGKIDNRLSTHLFIHVAQEQPVVAAILNIRRKRSGGASSQLEIQSEIANDFL